jgi:PAS domain S-box-containing protein
MEAPAGPTIEEVTRLQRCINDLVSVLALPLLWSGRGPSEIVSSFLDGIVTILDLDVAYVRLLPESGATSQHLRLPPDTHLESSAARRWFAALENDPAAWPRQMTLGPPGSPIAIEALLLGLYPGMGVVAAGSRRTGFPLQTEQLLLSVATNQLLLGLQHALHSALNEVKRSEASLQRVLDTIPVIAWCNLPDGPNEFLNQRWRDYTGMTLEESLGWGWQAAFHPEDLPPLLQRWSQMIVSGKPEEISARIRRHDGAYRWFLIRAEPFFNEANEITRWYGTSTDIDDRKRAEEALLASERELSQIQAELANVTRVTSLGVLTASIAHEVNQPLSGIITNAGTCLRMLTAQPPDIDGALETVRRTIRDGERAANVIARLRRLYIRKDLQLAPLDLNDTIREVVSLSLGELQRNRVILRQELADDLPTVAGDRIQLQQVILNLLRNASDAMYAVEDRPRELLIRTEPDDDGSVRLSVCDAGVGLTPQAIHKVFEPFYTTKSDGMGIGLSVSRSIIEAHRGRLWATPNAGAGVTFTFSLPP